MSRVTKRPKAAPRPGKPGQPLPLSGRPTTGRIVRMVTGQSHGFIRDRQGREVFFHRSDVTQGTFNDLAVGDTLGFEVIEDRLSGARAIRVKKVNKGGKRAGG